MGDIRLFRVADGSVSSIPSKTDAIEKSLQGLIERNLEVFLGVRFLASEFAITKSHGGRIDTLGIDASNNPVIVEYKRSLNENVINQGLFYLTWLVDHRADFTLLVMQKLGNDIASRINWRSPRLVCIAGDFTRYDEYAIQQIPQRIDLIRYRRYGEDLILLEQVAKHSPGAFGSEERASLKGVERTTAVETNLGDNAPLALRKLKQCSPEVQNWYDRLKAFALALGDDVEVRVHREYIAFRHFKNFAYVRCRPSLNAIYVGLAVLPPYQDGLEGDFVRGKHEKGIEVQIDSVEDVERTEPLLSLSYRDA